MPTPFCCPRGAAASGGGEVISTPILVMKCRADAHRLMPYTRSQALQIQGRDKKRRIRQRQNFTPWGQSLPWWKKHAEGRRGSIRPPAQICVDTVQQERAHAQNRPTRPASDNPNQAEEEGRRREEERRAGERRGGGTADALEALARAMDNRYRPSVHGRIGRIGRIVRSQQAT